MDIVAIKMLFKDFLSTTALGAMAAAAAADVLAGTYQALASGTFRWTLFGGWLESKVLKGILPVIIMYVASLGVTGPAHDGLVILATGGSATFIAAQIASIYAHFGSQPPPAQGSAAIG